MPARNAIVQAATVEVLCPYCGDPQPNPYNGGHAWMPDEVKSSAGQRTCVACDTSFRLAAQSRVSVPVEG